MEKAYFFEYFENPRTQFYMVKKNNDLTKVKCSVSQDSIYIRITIKY